LPAYLSAIEAGADGLECDVRLTRDGHLVCVHDRTVDRTSNGRGVVSELDLTRLQALDFGSWHTTAAGGSPTPDPRAAAEYLADVAPDRMTADDSEVLTLETLLAVVADAGRPLRLLIETKHPTRYGGLVEKELVRLLRRFGWATADGRGAAQASSDPVTIMSFAPIALRRIRLLAPGVPTVLLLERWSPIRRDGSLPAGVTIAGPGLRLIRSDPRYVERAHAQGNRVFCWTVDDSADVRFAARAGVDAIITNRPGQTRAILGESGLGHTAG
jgi:glycerophosphoryl diester phosphodiesterase